MAGVRTAVVVVVAYLSNMYREIKSKIPKQGPTRPQFLLDALTANEDIYYFGVGSNLSRTRLENRSIGKKIHPISFEPCVVYDFRLAFNLKGMPPLEPSMGSIEPLPSFFEKDDHHGQKKSRHLKRSDSKAFLAYDTNECHGALIKLSAHDYELVYK